jgi:hypothetical protein
MQWLLDEVYPVAEIIRVVLDNLATHKPATRYETFPPPEEARRNLRKPEFYYTIKRAGWLNMAEIESSVFGSIMNSSILPEQPFRSEVQALTDERNSSNISVLGSIVPPMLISN